MGMLEPKILISDISDSKITFSVRIWIREIDKKDEIVSELLEKILAKLKVEKIEPTSEAPSKIIDNTLKNPSSNLDGKSNI